jgi:hypothetical protein
MLGTVAIVGFLALWCVTFVLPQPAGTRFFAPAPLPVRTPQQLVQMPTGEIRMQQYPGPVYVAAPAPAGRTDHSWAGVIGWGCVGFAGTMAMLAVDSSVESSSVTAQEDGIEDIEAPATTEELKELRLKEFPPMSELELSEQEAKLKALSDKWSKREQQTEFEATIRSGWGPAPEILNGRFAMFFIIVGLVTEYYTGQSVPQQVYTMLQTLAIVE